MEPTALPNADLTPVVAVGGVVLATGPRVLLIKRGTPPLAGQWTLPGGRLRGGETIAAAVEREVLEETGIRVAAGSLVEVDPSEVPKAGDDADEARYVRPNELSSLAVTEAVSRVVMRGLAMRQAMNEDE